MLRRSSLLASICLSSVSASGCKEDSRGNEGSADSASDSGSGSDSDSASASGSGSDSDSDSGNSTPKLDVGGGGDGDGDGPPTFPTTCEDTEDGQTSVGCIFYPARVPGASGTAGFAVSNVSPEPATVTLSDINGQMDQAMIASGQGHVFMVDAHTMSSGTGVGSDGMVIESDQPLQVFQFLPWAAPPTADASIVLPGPALGTKHRVATYNVHSNNTHQYVAIVAAEDNTNVTFTLEQPGSETDAGGSFPALNKDMGLDTISTELDRLQHLVVLAHWENVDLELNELTGSLVESDKPIVVYSGKTLANIPEGQCCADFIATAVPPTTVYGTEYAGVVFLPVGQAKPDIWRVIGNADGTEITLSGGMNEVLQLDEGEFTDVVTADNVWMKGDKPFAAVHFMTAGSWNPPAMPLVPYDSPVPIGTPGDPALEWVYPKGNWLNRYLLRTGSTDWFHDHATVVAPMAAWDQITVDGMPLPAPTAIGGDTDHAFAYVPLPQPQHELLAPSTVGVQVEVYGYVGHGSYSYPGGMGLQTLNPEG